VCRESRKALAAVRRGGEPRPRAVRELDLHANNPMGCRPRPPDQKSDGHFALPAPTNQAMHRAFRHQVSPWGMGGRPRFVRTARVVLGAPRLRKSYAYRHDGAGPTKHKQNKSTFKLIRAPEAAKRRLITLRSTHPIIRACRARMWPKTRHYSGCLWAGKFSPRP